MRIRQPWLIKLVAFFGAWVIRGWMATLHFRYRSLGREVIPERAGPGERFVYAFWHENLLLPAHRFGRRDIWLLVSRHADGELIAEVCRHLRFRLVRGSTTRGGVEAVRRMLLAGRRGHLAITPDGPQGPRRRVQPGLIYVAARTGLPIVPAGFGFRRPWRARSWDRLALPRPWSVGTCVIGLPIAVPAGATREELEQYRRVVEEAIARVSDLAERWAETGRFPPLSEPSADSTPAAA